MGNIGRREELQRLTLEPVPDENDAPAREPSPQIPARVPAEVRGGFDPGTARAGDDDAGFEQIGTMTSDWELAARD